MPDLLKGLPAGGLAASIMTAAAAGNVAALNGYLAQPTAWPDFTNANGLSPLMVAAAHGQNDVVAVLAAHPLVNVGRPDPRNWTALHFATWQNKPAAVATLLKHHAPFDTVTVAGSIPFDLGNDETQKIFLKNTGFKRFLKLRDPSHPLLNPAAPAVLPDDAPEQEKPAAVLNESFYDALKSIGLALQKGAPVNAREQLNIKLAQMDIPNLAKAYRAIAQSGVKYDWDDVFIRAAAGNNTAAMVYLQDEIYFEQRVLDRALAAAARIPASRNAVHHLVVWAANPHARVVDGTIKTTPIDLAYAHGSYGALEEIVLWSNAKETPARIDAYVAMSKEKVRQEGSRKKDDGSFMAMISVSALLLHKLDMMKLNSTEHKEVLANAVSLQSGNITTILGTYAQAQVPRFMHGPTKFSPETGGAAMAWALVFNRIEFARKLAADGYRIGNAPASLQERAQKSGSPEARAFARENLMNTAYYPRIEDTGKRTTSPSAIRQLRTGLMID